MKSIFTLGLFLFLTFTNSIWAQISHGGKPLFYSNMLRSAGDNFFIEMPAFDVKEMLEEDSLNKSNMRGSFRFAKKFHTNIEKGKSGKNYTLADGTKVWQVGIRSKGAYSINVLFSEYHIPEGASLFLYSADRSHILGSFTHENNSEDNMLPISPVSGDEIIVEYQEPANAAFEGKLKISDINHDYRGVLRREPIASTSGSDCMPDIFCPNVFDSDNTQDPNDPKTKSVVLLVIDGTIFCTGTLINNTSGDDTPYLLTATHCLNNSFKTKNPDYTYMSGTIVAFLNYNKTICNPDLKMKGTEEFSLAGAFPACIIDTFDIALLRLRDTPPDYYQPYYAGWNVEYREGSKIQNLVPYTNIHHPGGAVKKYGKDNSALSLETLTLGAGGYAFYPNSHWKVLRWAIGSTAPGSSGSPLFDNQGLIVGGLSGGDSYCNDTSPNGRPDYFFALFRGWEYDRNKSNQLKTYLDPNNTGATHCQGKDPYNNNSAYRLSNVSYDNMGADTTHLTPPQTGYLFGHNSLQTLEFAEEYNQDKELTILGAYIIVPPLYSGVSEVTVNIYTGDSKPEKLIASEIFNPRYLNYNTYSNSFSYETKAMASRATESFVKFQDEVDVTGKFYISYAISYPTQNPFCTYYTPRASEKQNTAWLRDATDWFKASDHPYQKTNASLALQPLVKNKGNNDSIDNVPSKTTVIKYNRQTQQLHIDAEPNESGTIRIYSITGQLIDTFSYYGSSSFTIPTPNKGSIGIIKTISGEKSQVSKIIF